MNWKTIMFLLICLSLLPGCWDLSEIEEIGFVVAVAIDPLDENDEYRDQYRQETGRPLPKEMFQLTNQVVIPGQIEEGGGEAGGQGEGPFFNIRTVGMTNFKANRNFTTRRSRQMNFEHLKVVIINEKLARQGMMEHWIDFFARDHEMRRDNVVLISEGKGYEILEQKLPLELMPALSIDMITDNHARSHSIPPQKKIGELINNVIDHESYVIPRIVMGEREDFKIAGAAVFLGSENKMQGWLGEYDVQGFGWVKGNVENETVEAFYGPKQIPFVYENDNTESNITYKHENGKDMFDIEIKAEGFFVENWLNGVELDSEETLLKLEEEVASEIERLATNIIEKTQNEFFTDIFQLHDVVRRKNYGYWESVKGNWDGEGGVFANAEIRVNAKVKIRHYMTQAELDKK
ncbi:Ger(x)C family spore germination protein [Alkalihalobacillus sp. MEB130]|uniref:Ger(x)C family spore germination protein n=1 Tax=Alkalihalobacillus sp. MEB130 TaxID=2976704 RepID=UPI0028DFBC72|nr:Ger(x)C family spore germination protein [Alkalihalobacillus sp. MEB130]MDT8860873.1 Ger(x)C family spore germination protein [Alkalihalobacillus sp. MEB130]